MLPLLLALSLAFPAARPAPQVTLGSVLAEMAEKIDIYPPARPMTCTHSFLVDDDAELSVVAKALADLSAPDAPCRIVDTPDRSAAQPKWAFLVVEAPVDLDAKKILAAVRKGGKQTERLMATAFDSEVTVFGGPFKTPRDALFTSSNEIRWAMAWGRSYQIYGTPGKARSDQIAARLGKALGTKAPPPVIEHSFTWTLVEPVDAEAAKRAEKSLLAVRGVESARIDVAKRALAVTVALEGLDVMGPPIVLTGADISKVLGAEAASATFTMTKARFDTTPVFDALEREKLVVAPPAPAGK